MPRRVQIWSQISQHSSGSAQWPALKFRIWSVSGSGPNSGSGPDLVLVRIWFWSESGRDPKQKNVKNWNFSEIKTEHTSGFLGSRRVQICKNFLKTSSFTPSKLTCKFWIWSFWFWFWFLVFWFSGPCWNPKLRFPDNPLVKNLRWVYHWNPWEKAHLSVKVASQNSKY